MTRSQSYKSLWMTVLLGALGSHSVAFGAGLNTNVALTPPEDGTIIRFQWRYTTLSDDPTPLDRDVELTVNPLTWVYGISENLAVMATLPSIHRRVEPASGKDAEDTGVGDIPFLFKYRFYQDA